MNYELRIRIEVSKIPNLVGFVLFILFLPFYSYSQSSDLKSKTDKFGGIGVSVDMDSTVMLPYIVDILSGKPGAMAGLRSGDHIISINGWKTIGKSQEQVAGKLRGRVGSEVKLVIDRGGKEKDFTMKREDIEVNEKAGNFCEALDTLLKSGLDTFKSLHGILANDVTKWDSKLEMPGFDSTSISFDKTSPSKKAGVTSYISRYFKGSDSVDANNKYIKLIEDIDGCLPYTISDHYTVTNQPFGKIGYGTFFIIDKMKNNNFGKVKKLFLVIIFSSKKAGDFDVSFSCQSGWQ